MFVCLSWGCLLKYHMARKLKNDQFFYDLWFKYIYLGKSKRKQKNKTDVGLPIPVFNTRISQEDDTSSTTTESSTGDGEEKVRDCNVCNTHT